jgi:hypothetical protein
MQGANRRDLLAGSSCCVSTSLCRQCPPRKDAKFPGRRCDAALPFGASVDLTPGTWLFSVWECGEARWLDIIKGNLAARMPPQIGQSWREVWFSYRQEPVLFLEAVQQPALGTEL